eukprot:scaffold191074_cov19-Tisochrysis_lutea.AAC.2
MQGPFNPPNLLLSYSHVGAQPALLIARGRPLSSHGPRIPVLGQQQLAKPPRLPPMPANASGAGC